MFNIQEILAMRNIEQLESIAHTYSIDTTGLSRSQIIELVSEAIVKRMKEFNTFSDTDKS